MSEVHAPYHFVPLSKWMYMPDWAHLVSHDVPFKDGYCGKIHFSLTNATGLCVGGEQVKQDGRPSQVKWQRDPKGEPIIPGSSIKGMLRAVMEIATFGKFQRFNPSHFSYRNITAGGSAYLNELKKTDVQAYWLRFDGKLQKWKLRRAEHVVLFNDEFNLSDKAISNEQSQTVVDKYKLYPLNRPALHFSLKEREIKGTKGKMIKVKRAVIQDDGEFSGHPVFCGFRPGAKQYGNSRLSFNYLFYNADKQETEIAGGAQRVKDLFANHDEKLVEYLKQHGHPEYGIPIFARVKDHSFEALGFAKMPRKLYTKSVSDLVQAQQPNALNAGYFDMAELIFGCLRDNGLGLKSRVFCSDMSCNKQTSLKNSDVVILGQPKASYVNAYLEQPAAIENRVEEKKREQYEYQSAIAGWKRYPAQTQFSAPPLAGEQKGKVNVQSQIELMAPGAHFSGQIVFHNLKRLELGALLWVMQLGDKQPSPYFHGLGHGKPLGAGAVQLAIEQLDARGNDRDLPLPECRELIAEFVEHMNGKYPSQSISWLQSPQIEHLLAFAQREQNEGLPLCYMPLEKTNDPNRMSYVESNSDRQKYVLPRWRSGDRELKRKETLDALPAIWSFGQGRLKSLIGEGDEVAQKELAKVEQAIEAQKIAEQEAELAQLPELERTFILLERGLSPYFDNNDQAAKEKRREYNMTLIELINNALEGELLHSTAKALYAIANDKLKSAYLDLAKNKKNKERLNERRAILARFAAKYQLEL